MFEFIFNGTGPSGSLPSINCLTNPDTTCQTCPTTLAPEGKKNIRRNTSGILRKRGVIKPADSGAVANDSNSTIPNEAEDLVVVIDVGKTFMSAAIEWFPKYGLRKIDAVLLTHCHADATNGLDDLRSWTLKGIIQDYIDIYLSVECFNEIKRAFPYLVSKGFATGGGDVPDFRWHIIQPNTPFSIGGEDGFWITPIYVDHGLQFPTSAVPQPMPLNKLVGLPNPGISGISTPSPFYAKDEPSATSPVTSQTKEPTPFKCFAFVVNNVMVYMSDVSNISEEAWQIIQHPPALPSASSPDPSSPQYQTFIVDVLRPAPFVSHFGLDQAVSAVRRLSAKKNYLIGPTHELNHDQWVSVGEGLEKPSKGGDAMLPAVVQEALDVVSPGPAVWFRPSFDGLRIVVPEEGDPEDVGVDGYSS